MGVVGAVSVSASSGSARDLAASRATRVFVSHAYPTPLSPALDFTLSILEGKAAVRARECKGAIKGDVLLAGLDGDSAPLDPSRFERLDQANALRVILCHHNRRTIASGFTHAPSDSR